MFTYKSSDLFLSVLKNIESMFHEILEVVLKCLYVCSSIHHPTTQYVTTFYPNVLKFFLIFSHILTSECQKLLLKRPN